MAKGILEGWNLPDPVALFVGLIPATIVFVAVIAVSLFAARDKTRMATLADCQAIKEAAGRLACYDNLAKGHLAMPAKGGQVPQ